MLQSVFGAAHIAFVRFRLDRFQLQDDKWVYFLLLHLSLTISAVNMVKGAVSDCHPFVLLYEYCPLLKALRQWRWDPVGILVHTH